MKVRVDITVEIDPAQWELDYGVARSEVRADVQTWARYLITETLRDNGHPQPTWSERGGS